MKAFLALFLAASAAFTATVPRPAPELAIQMQDGSQTLLSKYRGKTVVLALVYTTCPHCQHTSGLLGQIQKEYAAKGVQVLGAAFNDDARGLVPAFSQQYVKGAFPMGSLERNTVLEFLQLPVMAQFYVPILVFVDKAGHIQSQHIGDEDFFRNQETSIRAEIEKILAKPAASPRTTTHKTAIHKTTSAVAVNKSVTSSN
jgi:thiol-disulfide isomerase/thioredoxin